MPKFGLKYHLFALFHGVIPDQLLLNREQLKFYKIIPSAYRFKKLLMGIMLGLSSCSYASGFQLFEQNGAAVGDYDSGVAAEGNDASIAWYNPAGLVLLHHTQLVLAAVGIDAGLQFEGNVQNYAKTVVPGLHGTTRTLNLLGSDEYGKAQGGGFIGIPAMHLAVPLNDRFVAGLSVVVPFGLESNWPEDSVARYSATDTKIVDIDITPTLAMKITDKFSIGAGIDFQNVSATFDQVVGLGELKTFNTDTTSKNEASQWVTGWHGGVLYQFTPQTRVGLAYHSKVDIHATGTSTFQGPLMALATNGVSDEYKTHNLESDVTLPGFFTFSIFHQINDRWAVKASANYTEWHVFDNVPLYNVAGVQQVGSSTNFEPAILDVNVPQNFKNTLRLAAGLNFQQTERWMWRAGLGFDQDPTNNTDRNLRLPDGDIFAATVGARYQATKHVSFDASYQHLFVQPGEINNLGVVGAQQTYVNGSTQNTGDLYALQMNWDIT